MKVVAPGKLLLAGAYAVLEGWPSLVVAVDRYAAADGDAPAPRPTPEVLAAMDAAEAPLVDASLLREGPSKLGLGSSAAILVASLGVREARLGGNLADPAVRLRMFRDARRAHGKVQKGGSGVDVAASVYGGAIEYVLGADDSPSIAPTPLPERVVLDVFWSGTPVTTTDMRGRIDAFRGRDARGHAGAIAAVGVAARVAIASARDGDAGAFVKAIRQGGVALAALGAAADAPIYPPSLVGLVDVANADDAAFIPSGAGGGDVFVHVALAPASPEFLRRTLMADMRRVPMRPDARGVRITDT